jgi:hypothetical protein
MKRHKDSHLDHGLTEAQVEFLLSHRLTNGPVVVKTLELPEELGTVPCALYGPLMGDYEVLEWEVTMESRGKRGGYSRMVDRPVRQVRQVTVVAGPHDGLQDVLYTAYGGPAAPREPYDCPAGSPELEESRAFWRDHALARI